MCRRRKADRQQAVQADREKEPCWRHHGGVYEVALDLIPASIGIHDHTQHGHQLFNDSYMWQLWTWFSLQRTRYLAETAFDT